VFFEFASSFADAFFARKQGLFLKISLSYFGANVYFCAQAWCVTPFFVCVFFQQVKKCVLSGKKHVFCTFCHAPAGPCAPRGLQITPGSTTFPVFYDGFCDFAEKPSQLSSKMPIFGPAGAYPSKKVRHSRAKRRLRKKPPPLSHGMHIFDPAAPKKAIPCESGEGEGRFASQNTWFWTHSRPKMAIPSESGESVNFFQR
jgi:hypothetical protein